MNEVLTEQNSLMEKIVREHGAMIRQAVFKASSGLSCPEDIISEVYFAILLTLRKLGDGWTPPRSFVFAVVRNKVNDYLRQKYRDRNRIEEIKKRLGEQTFQREEVVAKVHTLSHCEFQVFRLLGLGLTNQEIAESLNISPHTVRSHIKKVHAKCGIRDRAKLSLIAHQACYRESPKGRDEEPSSAAPDSHMFLRRGSHSGRVWRIRESRDYRHYV
jgi:RNA polymerase sigma factor (sigma-70 family)